MSKLSSNMVVSSTPSKTNQSKLVFRASRKLPFFFIAFVLYIVLLQSFNASWNWFLPSRFQASIIRKQDQERNYFDWADIVPNKKLVFKPCHDGFQCARLEVPMNWQDPNNIELEKVVLAIIKKPARVHITHPQYGGAVMINPGGPGGSGIGLVLTDGKEIQTIVDADSEPSINNMVNSTAKFYDVVSFDPRGVGETTPALDCFPDEFARSIWKARKAGEGLIGSFDGLIEYKWARAHALADRCSSFAPESNAITKYMNTASVVYDMVELIERLAESRESEVRSWSRTNVMCSQEREEVLARSAWAPGEEKLIYWGFSYGTLLGSTFAAMQPHRVGRLVLDGVVNAKHYYNMYWLDLDDADAVMDQFFEYCFEAGPDQCALYSHHGASAIGYKVKELLESIRLRPMPVAASDTRGPDIITHSDIMMLVANVLYIPLERFNGMANMLHGLQTGNGSLLADYKQQNSTASCPSLECRRSGPFSDSCNPKNEYFDEVRHAIACSDGIDITNTTRVGFQTYLNDVRAQSRWLGEHWSEIFTLPCIHWKTRPAWTFEGPIAGNTSSPILFIGNTYDPVTPLLNARTMSSRFPGSAVLQQNSEGHCTLASPSLCTAKIIREYFQSGTLPRENTVCEPNERPFGLPGTKDAIAGTRRLTSGERELLAALKTLGRRFRNAGVPL